MHEMPSGVSGDSARDDGLPSSREVVDRSFFGRQRHLPHPFSAMRTPCQVYVSEHGSFHLSFGNGMSFGVDLWTNLEGFEELIRMLLSAKVHAENLGIAEDRPLVPLDPMDVPF